MNDIETICPYTGLRSFTEDESLYFKGRDEQILKVIAQLEEKKFLMLTGASGDGKSSLIFAGLIPQARAGFFKAKYSNWHVADFRPERSPLKNMASALSGALKHDKATIEVELSRGFSSLVELYKSSVRFTDTEGSAFKSAAANEQEHMEREAGNLLILIDQFEEFFTNPENFPGGVPSQESRLLLNIILETVKISLKDDLPIYVVCTMRSDYIGQCAAFRGLPEFIGFSQFFVPRLQRKELHQVIEEPAILSGNRISNRLIDRLIFDLEDGTDQLPILQHALKQIWKAADSGRQEMDLIHYAMVGGMPGDTLPREEIDQFQTWKSSLPGYEKEYLEHPGLSNVLDIHANKLYEEAAVYCKKHGVEITPKQAKFIIAMSFACLTRIDENRAVRNRMTLEEITHIINVPQFTNEVVGRVLSIYREPENTLVRPFMEEGHKLTLSPSAVIDITHEALIRNWKLLKKWSNQEYEFYVTFLDFQQQVKRWIEHGKSDDFLLPIGSLTYFETWYERCHPNQYWINRYNNDEGSAELKLKQSVADLKNSRSFLRKSALRLLITRTFMKYGAGRIAAVTALLAFLVFSGFSIYRWNVQRNENVLDRVIAEGETLLADKEPISFSKGFFTIDAENLRPGFFNRMIHVLPEQQKIDVAIDVFGSYAVIDLKGYPPILRQSILAADSLVNISGVKIDTSKVDALNLHLKNLNDLIRNQSYYLFQKFDEPVREKRDRNAKSQATLLTKILLQPSPSRQLNMKALHTTVVGALNHKGFTAQEIKVLLDSVSPLENNRAKPKFSRLFPATEKITVGFSQNLSHNGGYQMLAYLYAALGNVNRTRQCLDTLKKYNENYNKAFINSTHVSAYFPMYGHSKEFREFIQGYSKELGIPAHFYLKEILNASGVMYVDCVIEFVNRGHFNHNIAFLDQEIKKGLFNLTREFSQLELKTPDARNFNLAILTKLEGVLMAKKNKEKGVSDNRSTDSLFQTAMAYYNKVSPKFLEEAIEANVQINFINTEKRIMPRKHLFLYPDHFKTVDPFIQPGWFRFYDDSFFKFMAKNNLFSKLYRAQEDYQLIITWINTYFAQLGNGNRSFLNYPDLDHITFHTLDSLVKKSGYDLDDAWIKMVLIQDSFKSGDTTSAFRVAKNLKFKEFEKQDAFEDGDPFHNNQIIVAGELAKHGQYAEAMKIIRLFSNNKNRIVAYSKLAAICQVNQKLNEARIFQDSAEVGIKRLKNYEFNAQRDFRTPLVELLTLQNNNESRERAVEFTGAMPGFNRVNGVITMVWAYSRIDEYHKARQAIPELTSADDRLFMLDYVLVRENIRKGNNSGEWSRYYKFITDQTNFVFFQNDLEPN